MTDTLFHDTWPQGIVHIDDLFEVLCQIAVVFCILLISYKALYRLIEGIMISSGNIVQSDLVEGWIFAQFI